MRNVAVKAAPIEEAEVVSENAHETETFFICEGNHLEAMKVNPAGVLQAMNTLIN